MMTAKLATLGLTSALVFAGCTKDKPAPNATATAASPGAPAASPPSAPPAPSASVPAPTPAAAPRADDQALSGTVAETMSSGGYTYARLDRGGSEVWVAGPETPLTVGTKLAKLEGTLMPGFHSPTLNRTFDQIYFVGTFGVPGSPGAQAAGTVATAAVEAVAKAPGGKTIAEVFASKEALIGKPVTVRGKVVKVNNGILGRNWIHLQDGSGAPGTNDLTVTTAATATPAAKDSVVVVHGTLATNRDFGAGYSYSVLIEDATVSAN
jgi:hypothetical protein